MNARRLSRLQEESFKLQISNLSDPTNNQSLSMMKDSYSTSFNTKVTPSHYIND